MSEASDLDGDISADDLRRYNWQAIIAAHPDKESHSYFEPLRMEAYRLREAGDLQGFRALAFLANIAALHPDYSQPGNPYEPPWQPPQQLSGHGLDAFESIIDEIKDPEFRARVGDVLWEFRQRPKAAATAVRSLIESAQRLESLEHWPLFTQRLERALTLSAKLGHAKPLHVEVLKQVESLILKYKNVKEAGFLCAELIEMLARQKRLDSAAYATVTRELAELFTAAEKWDQAHEYWKLCAKFSAGGDSKDALIRGAECWVRKAEANLSGEKPDQLFAAHWMGMAFQELQQAGASEERKREVHRRFRELQTLGMQQMAPVKLSPDLEEKIETFQSRLIELGRGHVAHYPFDKALLRLAFMVPLPDPEEIKRRVDSESSQSVWVQLTPTATVTESGLKSDQLGPRPTSPGTDLEEWRLKSAYFHARRFEWPQLAVLADAAREQIVDEHPGRIEQLRFLVTSNPFIAAGHERIFLRGLHAGLVGDWVIAVHLLVPQLEASIRSVFDARGIVTSTVESEGIQKERLLSKLLYHPKMESVFGDEATFNLRGVLVEKFGFNLRNDMAHGLISEAGFFSPASIVLWWLALQLCSLGASAATDRS